MSLDSYPLVELIEEAGCKRHNDDDGIRGWNMMCVEVGERLCTNSTLQCRIADPGRLLFFRDKITGGRSYLGGVAYFF